MIEIPDERWSDADMRALRVAHREACMRALRGEPGMARVATLLGESADQIGAPALVDGDDE